MTSDSIAVFVPREAAKYLRVGHNAAYDLLRTGALDGWRDANGRWRVSRAALERFIEQQEERQRQERTLVVPLRGLR